MAIKAGTGLAQADYSFHLASAPARACLRPIRILCESGLLMCAYMDATWRSGEIGYRMLTDDEIVENREEILLAIPKEYRWTLAAGETCSNCGRTIPALLAQRKAKCSTAEIPDDFDISDNAIRELGGIF